MRCIVPSKVVKSLLRAHCEINLETNPKSDDKSSRPLMSEVLVTLISENASHSLSWIADQSVLWICCTASYCCGMVGGEMGVKVGREGNGSDS